MRAFDGLRGLTVLGVAFLHYLLTFDISGYAGYGSSVEGDLRAVVSSGLPVSLIKNSLFPVHVFLALIAFVIVVVSSGKQDRLKYLQRAAKTRYFRFLIPVVASTVIFYVMHNTGFLRISDMA